MPNGSGLKRWQQGRDGNLLPYLPYLASLNPAGIARSLAATSVAMLSTSVVPVVHIHEKPTGPDAGKYLQASAAPATAAGK